MSEAREHLFKMLTAFSFDEIDQEFVDWNLFERIECLVKKLLDGNHGVKRKSEHKHFATVSRESFTGAEFLQALQRIVGIKEIAEAVNLGNILLSYGYIYPADAHNNPLSFKDDGTLYLFQSPSYWPSQKPDGSEEDYGAEGKPAYSDTAIEPSQHYQDKIAIYLVKKKLLTKKKNVMNQHEQAHLAKLIELFGSRWSKVVEKAEEQCRALREKKKIERVLLEREEESFWRIHRLHDDAVDVFDVGVKRFCNRYSKKELRTLSLLKSKIESLKESTNLSRIPTSIAINNLISHGEQYAKVDVLLDTENEVASSSRWYKDFEPRTNTLTILCLERWSISLRDLLSDKKGVEHFTSFLKKEFSEENVSFWLSCEDLKFSPKSKIRHEVMRIYRDFMAPGARFEINVDNEAMSSIQEGLRDPSAYAFDLAQDQVFKLMSTDCYPRFLKSNDYRDLVTKAKSAETSSNRKSNNRILNAARGLVTRSSLGDIFSSNLKQHAQLCRSSSDFQMGSSKSKDISRNTGSTSWFIQRNNPMERCSSENDISALGISSSQGSPASPHAIPHRMKLKGLPILKLSRSKTPNCSPTVSPGPSTPTSYSVSPLVSPISSPFIARKFEYPASSEKRPKQHLVNGLNEKVSKEEIEKEDDINNWEWQRIPHDFF